jgi:uncharacterized protein (DUF2235 family)
LNQKKYGFLDTALHPCVERACHAVSIDERRAQFKSTLWTNPDGSFRPNDAQVEQVWFAGVHSDVGGGYQECDLSDITLSWMMQKARENGLVFSPAAEAQYLTPRSQIATGPAHDEWKIVPWGIPEHRTIPPAAVMSNTVQTRLDDKHLDYKPENLKLNGTKLVGYPTAQVLPYQKP